MCYELNCNIKKKYKMLRTQCQNMIAWKEMFLSRLEKDDGDTVEKTSSARLFQMWELWHSSQDDPVTDSWSDLTHEYRPDERQV